MMLECTVAASILLEKAKLPGDQAKAILEVMDLELASQRDQLATKDDLARELARFELILRTSLSDFKTEVRDRLYALELQMQAHRTETARWILGASGGLIGAFGVMLGLFYLFTNHLGK